MDGSAYEEFMQEWIPLGEAAERLEVTREQLDTIIAEYQWEVGTDELGAPAVFIEDIELFEDERRKEAVEAAKREKRRALKAAWKPGKVGVQAFGRSGVQDFDNEEPEPTGPDLTEGYWVTLAEAGEMLGVTANRVATMVDEGKLAVEYGRRSPGMALRKPKTRHRKAWVRLSAVMELAEARAQRSWEQTIAPGPWRRGPTLKPYIRTTLEAPAGDRLISAREAADLLGVTVAFISDLVGKGRLFGWQTQPGRQGCKLWLSERQVLQYREDRDARRAERGRPVSGMTNREAWMEWNDLTPERLEQTTKNSERDYGVFFSTPQVCQVLGITRGAVRQLRKRGRLKGYQNKRKPSEGNGGKWWFYKKEDVYALQADRQYRKHSAVGKWRLRRLWGEV